MPKKAEESYRLTFKGFCVLHMGQEKAKSFLDSLELLLRRSYSTVGVPAVVFEEETGFRFDEVYYTDKVKQKKLQHSRKPHAK